MSSPEVSMKEERHSTSRIFDKVTVISKTLSPFKNLPQLEIH